MIFIRVRTNRSIFLAAVMVLLIFPAHSQVSVAPKIGLSYSHLSGDFSNAKYMPGAFFGGMVNVKIQELYSFQGGIILAGKGSTLKYSETDTDQMLISYLELPFNQVLTVPAGSGSLQLFAGPYIGFAINGRYKYLEDENDMSEKLQIGTSDTDEIKPFDGGIGLGVGFLFEGFEVQGGYSRSLTNISNLPVDKLYNNVITISMAYYFELNPQDSRRRWYRK